MTAPGTATAPGVLIDGEWVATAEKVERTDPSDPARVTGTFSRAGGEHVAHAYEAAEASLPDWSSLPAGQRGDVLRRAADLLEARAEEAARRLTADMGKAQREARGEIARSVSILRYAAGETLQPWGETFPSTDPEMLLMTVEQPVGVVCAITPWSFPFAIPAWKLAPALAFGNAAVWKPAELAAGSAVMLAEIMMEAGLPPGVLNLVSGPGSALASRLTGDPLLAALTFTGSTGTGMAIKEALAHETSSSSSRWGARTRRSCSRTPTSPTRRSRSRAPRCSARASAAPQPAGSMRTAGSSTSCWS
jgi:aldehyde dehydrogenase (NAD+)